MVSVLDNIAIFTFPIIREGETGALYFETLQKRKCYYFVRPRANSPPQNDQKGASRNAFLVKKRRLSERLQNGIVKKRKGFPSKSPHGFAKNGLARVPENAPARARPTRRPELPQIGNATISLYRVKIHLPKKLKRGLPGESWEVDFESVLV